MTLKSPLIVIVALLLGAATATSAISDAHACGFFNYREAPPVLQPVAIVPAKDRVAAAEQHLEEERPIAAADEVVTAFPTLVGDARTRAVGGSPLETRARRILSLAVVRGGGTLRGVRGFSGAGEVERSANLEWAATTLRAIDAARPNDPAAHADLAEALAAQGPHEEESLAILADLASRDLLGSAHAYATLARLRASRGDTAASRAALDRCELMTRSPVLVCRAPDGRLAVRG